MSVKRSFSPTSPIMYLICVKGYESNDVWGMYGSIGAAKGKITWMKNDARNRMGIEIESFLFTFDTESLKVTEIPHGSD